MRTMTFFVQFFLSIYISLWQAGSDTINLFPILELKKERLEGEVVFYFRSYLKCSQLISPSSSSELITNTSYNISFVVCINLNAPVESIGHII